MRLEPTVLIVEDEARMRELLLRAIGGWGMRVSAARTGEEALRAIDAQPADILVLDLNLPGISGMELLEKARVGRPGIQAIILTGFGDLEAAKRAVHFDVVEFLTKPCHLGELELALDKARRRLDASSGAGGPLSATEPPAGDGGTAVTLDEVEREHILSALARHAGNRAETAEELGISLRTLYYRLEEYRKRGFEL